MNLKYLFLFLLLLPSVASAKLNPAERNRMMQEAIHAFQAGKYDEARKIYYDIYVEDGDKSSKELLDKCQQCRTLIADATAAERNGDYEKAIEKYQTIISLNPSDNNIPVLISQCKQKIYAPKLQLAKQCYREGKYIEARDNLYEYTSLSGATDPNLLTAITEGITWSDEAKLAFDKKDYNLAKFYYDKLLAANPTDATSAIGLAEVNRLNSEVKTVFVKTPSNRLLRPTKNKFAFFVYSGFGRPVGIGGGISFNVSYFNLGIDAGGCESAISDNKYISDSDLGKFVKTDDNTYTQGTLQLAVTPGVNLKYVGVGVGLGTMMTNECTVTNQLSSIISVDVTNKNRFLIRPTVTGYIPFDSDYTAGLIIMAGYNIVSGVSGLNQFILGVGMFF